jgi:D-alanine--poly(phosphoribitol) ligase subunit 1
MLGQIRNSFKNFPDRNAFCIHNTFYTYNQLKKVVDSIVCEIQQRCRDEKLIGIVANDDIFTYASIIALWHAGKGYVPIHPKMPAERNISVINQSGIKTVLTALPDETKEYSSSIKKLIDLSDLKNEATHSQEISPDKNSLAYLLFTSGSTGIPKGVPITFENLDAFVSAFFDIYKDISEEDRFLQMFDLTFDLSVISYVIPLCRGACVYTIPYEGMKYMNVYSALEDKRITVAMMVPSVIAFLRQYFCDIHLPDMRYSLFCGEALYTDIIKEWQACIPNAEIHNVYGPTEGTVFCITYHADFTSEVKSYNGITCIGKSMNNVEAIICNETGQVVECGEKGELCLGGPQVMSGYWNEPSKTESAFFNIGSGSDKKPFYKTGDVAFVDMEGNFFYCGRTDNQVKIQGYRVELAEIEFVAKEFVHENRVAAIVKSDIKGNNEVFLYVENFKDDTVELLDFMKERLPVYMLPREIYKCEKFPMNLNGKIDRKILKEWIKI